jgi:hypothetical protein
MNETHDKMTVIERICKREHIKMNVIENEEKKEDGYYWIGTHGCLVSSNINTCISADEINTRYKDGLETELYKIGEIPSKKEWLEKYTLFDDNTNNYYYKKKFNVIYPFQFIIGFNIFLLLLFYYL